MVVESAGAIALKLVRELLREACVRSVQIQTETEWTRLVEKTSGREWVFLISWSKEPALFCWGFTAGEGKRLRYSGILNNNIVGHHDYRVDFFMLKKIFGPPTIEIFEYTRDAEQKVNVINRRLNVKHPWFGIPAQEAGDITKVIYANFQKSRHWVGLEEKAKARFRIYMSDVYFAKLKHPSNTKREYFYSDSLDGDFLALIHQSDLIDSIETVLDCRFQKRKFTIKNIETTSGAVAEPVKDLNDILSEIEKDGAENLLASLKRS